jgi:hypothetical protein
MRYHPILRYLLCQQFLRFPNRRLLQAFRLNQHYLHYLLRHYYQRHLTLLMLLLRFHPHLNRHHQFLLQIRFLLRFLQTHH